MLLAGSGLGCPDYFWAIPNSPVWATMLQEITSRAGKTLHARAALGWSDCVHRVASAREGNKITHWSSRPALGSGYPSC